MGWMTDLRVSLYLVPALLALCLLAACASQEEVFDATSVETLQEKSVLPTYAPWPNEAEDFCARFNREEQERRRRGSACYCPCACSGGEISCAPCIPCDPHLEESLEVIAPEGRIGK